MAYASFMDPKLLVDEKNHLQNLKLSNLEIQNVFKGAFMIIAFQFIMISSIIVYIFILMIPPFKINSGDNFFIV